MEDLEILGTKSSRPAGRISSNKKCNVNQKGIKGCPKPHIRLECRNLNTKSDQNVGKLLEGRPKMSKDY